MGVEARHGDPRCGHAEIADQRRMGDAQCPLQKRGVRLCGTSASGMWIVAGTTRSRGEASIITTARRPPDGRGIRYGRGRQSPRHPSAPSCAGAPSPRQSICFPARAPRRGRSRRSRPGHWRRRGAVGGRCGEGMRQHRQNMGRQAGRGRRIIHLGQGRSFRKVPRVAQPDERHSGPENGPRRPQPVPVRACGSPQSSPAAARPAGAATVTCPR